jgi:hypothetical protein
LKKLTLCSPHWNGELLFISLCVEYLHEVSGILLQGRLLFTSTYLFSHLITSVWVHGYLFQILGYNATLLSLFHCSNHFNLAIRNTFSWLLCSFDTYPVMWVCVCIFICLVFLGGGTFLSSGTRRLFKFILSQV